MSGTRRLSPILFGIILAAAPPGGASAQELGDTKWFGWGIIHTGNYYTLERTVESGDCDIYTGNCPGGSFTRTEDVTVTWTAEAKLGGAYFVEAGMGGTRSSTDTKSVTYTSAWYHSECKPCATPVTVLEPDGGFGGEDPPDDDPEDSPSDPDSNLCIPDEPCLEHEYRSDWKKGECWFGDAGDEAGCGNAQQEHYGACVLPAIHIFSVQPYEQWVFQQHEYRCVPQASPDGEGVTYVKEWVPVPGECRSYVAVKGVQTVGEPSVQAKHVMYRGYKDGLVVLPGCWCEGWGDRPRKPTDEPSPPGDDPTPPKGGGNLK